MTHNRLSDDIFGPEIRPANRILVGRPFSLSRGITRNTHADKAVSQRATLLASLCTGTSTIENVADCRDTRSNLDLLSTLGIGILADTPSRISIVGRPVTSWRNALSPLEAGNSATTARLLTAILAGGVNEYVITGNSSLRSRPMAEIVDPLKVMGADLTYLESIGNLPIHVRGRRLAGGTVQVEVDSAQPVSALLFAGLNASAPVRVRRRVPARDHTERLLRWTGVDVAESPRSLTITPGEPRSFSLRIAGDTSGAALLAALHLGSPQATSTLTIPGVGINHRRTGFLRALRRMGAMVRCKNLRMFGPEPVGDVLLNRGPAPLRGIEMSDPFEIQSLIDEIPLLAALATVSEGPTVIRNAQELRGKDTDRLFETVSLLEKFECRAHQTDDGLVVHPRRPTAPTSVSLPPDHRVIFAAMVLTLLCGGGVELIGLSATATSWPRAVDDLAQWAPLEFS